MSETSAPIEVPGKGQVSAQITQAPAAGWLFVYAPGAGSSIDDPFGVYASNELPDRGVDVLRFQFPYQERRARLGKAGGPDRNEVLEATWRAALARAREVAGPGVRIVAGGRSMGGRIASQVASDERLDALALFAYPLHPPGRPLNRRDQHLAAITAPVLFCSGTRDDFASPEELTDLVKQVPSARLSLLEGADHGFGVRKASGRTREDVWREACDALVAFLEDLSEPIPA